MIDWHCHILPGMDDGSRNINESLQLLEMQKAQGVNTVVATPHFYANEEPLHRFLERRRNAFELLSAALPEGYPEIVLGAEVRYYEGISRLSGIEGLCIGNSNIILIEMPMGKWTEYSFRELVELNSCSGMQVAIAHMDRYMKYQKKDMLHFLYANGLLIQYNASFFLQVSTRRKALSMFRDNAIHFIGSDCHNITSRPPKIGAAFDIIVKKYGGNVLNELTADQYRILNK